MKLVIVDDEKGIIDGLLTIVKRYLSFCRVVGTAHNGLDGFRMVQELKPDIVITDIRMPQSDGLDMIRRLTEAGCEAKFILLSGYAEFEYARKGMELGVKFYINKPVEEEELLECVSKVAAEIETRKAQQRQWKEFLLRDMLDTGYSPEVHAYLQLSVADHYCACAVLELGSGGPNGEQAEAVSQALEAWMEELPYSRVEALPYENAQYAVLLVDRRKPEGAVLERELRRLQTSLRQACSLPAAIGVGQAYPSPDGITASFGEAREALRYKVVKGPHALITYKETGQLKGTMKLVPEESLTRLEACLDDMDAQGCAGVIEGIFQEIQGEAGLKPADLQHQMLIILLSCMRRMSLEQLQVDDLMGQYILPLEDLSRFTSLDEAQAWLIEAVSRMIEQRRARIQPRKKDVIAEIKEYVASNYAGNVTLADLSARFFINPYYLSQLFKDKTGDTYLSYLLGVRMAKAKELLEQTDLRVYEICRMVGYADTNHFSKLFEKMSGSTPSEYRKLHQS